MAAPGTSLIERDQSQALLWSDDQIPAEVSEVESAEGHYSGERLFLQKPEVYRAIVYLLACGAPRTVISKKLGVHHKTVGAVAFREAGSIASQKRELAAMARHGVAVAMDSVIDDLANNLIKPGQPKAVTLGILADTMIKMEQGSSSYEGGQFDGSTPAHAAYDEFLATLSPEERSALAKMGRAAEKAVAKEQAGNEPIEADFTMQPEVDS